MPSFIAATEPLPAAQTVKRNACSFFSFFSCTDKKRTRFSFPKEKNMSFSHRRENDEKSRRDAVSDSQPSTGKRIHTAPNRRNRAPACALRHSPCGGSVQLGSPRPQAQDRRSALATRSACSAVDCANLRAQTRAGSRRNVLSVCTNGQAGGLRLLFVLFLSAQEKNTFLSFPRKKNVPSFDGTFFYSFFSDSGASSL